MGQYDDKFFRVTTCERCGESLSGHARTMSWFTEETICTSGRGKRLSCASKEDKIKKALRERGENPIDYEGCGYVPVVDNAKHFIVEK